MKFIYISFVFLLFVSCATLFQGGKNKAFSIIFGSCFNDDIYTIQIDGLNLDTLNLSSNFSLGLVKYAEIRYAAPELTLNKSGEIKSYNIELNTTFKLQLDGKKSLYRTIDVSTGKYIVIDGCGIGDSLVVNQYKKPPEFD